MRQFTDEIAILNAKDSTGVGKILDVTDYNTIIVSISTASSADLVVKFAGSIKDTCPTFTDAQSPSNLFDYLQAVDLQNASATNGDTGFVVSGSDDTKTYEINVNGIKWFAPVVTTRNAGSVTAVAKCFGAGNGRT